MVVGLQAINQSLRALGLESHEEGSKREPSLEPNQGPDGSLHQDTEVKSLSTFFLQTGVFGADRAVAEKLGVW